jgi:predicted N-acetyltransferase YhbS
MAASFVAVSSARLETAGFYTLSAPSVALGALEPALARRLPRYPAVPAALLGRLAVALKFQGRGLGAALLADALKRAASAQPRVFAMLVDAEDAVEQAFYEKHGFKLLAGERGCLALPISQNIHLR